LNRGLEQYRIGPGGADEFGSVMDPSAPFVLPPDDNTYAEFHTGASQGHAVPQNTQSGPAAGPISELLQLAVQYSKTNPLDLSHMLERIRIAKKIEALVPEIVKESEVGRERILVELGIATAKPVKKPRAAKVVA